jgi:hypothetical protein
MAIDLQHYIRYTRSLKVLAWLGNDPLAKLELAMASACFHLGFHQYWTNWYGNKKPWGLSASMQYVDAHPGWGVAFGRGQGWGVDAAVAAYAFGDDEHRELYDPWFRVVADTLEAGQSDCTGIIQATPSSKYHYRTMQSFEVSIVENALWSMRTSVFEVREPARDEQLRRILEESIRAQISPLVWRDEWNGPVHWMATGSPDVEEPPYCAIPTEEDAQAYGADHVYCWADFAYAFALTEDPIFLEKAKQVGGTGDLYGLLHDSGLDNLGAKAPMLSLVQTLNGE